MSSKHPVLGNSQDGLTSSSCSHTGFLYIYHPFNYKNVFYLFDITDKRFYLHTQSNNTKVYGIQVTIITIKYRVIWQYRKRTLGTLFVGPMKTIIIATRTKYNVDCLKVLLINVCTS